MVCCSKGRDRYGPGQRPAHAPIPRGEGAGLSAPAAAAKQEQLAQHWEHSTRASRRGTGPLDPASQRAPAPPGLYFPRRPTPGATKERRGKEVPLKGGWGRWVGPGGERAKITSVGEAGRVCCEDAY